MLGEIRRYLRHRTWSVRVSRGLQELALRVDKTVVELPRDLHRQPTVAELARAAAATEEQVLEALQPSGAYRAMSLETPRTGEDEAGDSLGDTVAGTGQGFGLAEDRATLAQLLPAVTPREREVLRLRFEDDLTQREIGGSQMQTSRITRHGSPQQPNGRRQPTGEPVGIEALPTNCREHHQSFSLVRQLGDPGAQIRGALADRAVVGMPADAAAVAHRERVLP
jgi:DNA-directed RNA polymerase specialized sigma24 family protein